MLKKLVHRLGRAYQRKIVELDVEAHGKFRRHNERPVEFAFVFSQIAKLAPKTVLDVGSGDTALPALMANCGCEVTATDNVTDYWPDGMFNRHWMVLDDNISTTALSGPYDLVTCVSVLEHVVEPSAAVRNMLKLARNGHLIVTCPFTAGEHVDNCYKQPGANQDYADLPYGGNSYSMQDLDGWLSEYGGSVVEIQFWRGFTGRHWALGTRIAPPHPSTIDGPHNHACILIRASCLRATA